MAKLPLPQRIVAAQSGGGFMGFALFRKSTAEVIKRRQATPGRAANPDGSFDYPVGGDPDLHWLVEYDGDQPAYDANANRLERGEAVSLELDAAGFGRLTTTYSTVPLSQREIKSRRADAHLEASKAEIRRVAKKLDARETTELSELAEVVRALALLSGLQLDEE